MKRRLVQTAVRWCDAVASTVQRHPHRWVMAVAAVLLGGTGATFAVVQLAPDVEQLPLRQTLQAVEPLRTQAAVLEDQAMRLYRSEVSRSADSADLLLRRLGIWDAQAAAFLRTDTLVQQTLLGRTGRSMTAEADRNNALLKLSARWSPEDDGMFKRLSVEKTPQGFISRLETLPLGASSRLASGVISSSLFAATDAARIPDAIAIQLAEIFAGDIDFHRALRKGDRFSVSYETLEGDGEPLRAGRVLSAEFVNAGKTYQAMWFQEPEPAGSAASGASHSLTKGGYYTLAGESLRRAYLASPLAFSRITSGFKMRFHPILQSWRAHLGVDYGAATGTPVRSIGDGMVEFAGVQSGFGNVVIVKHRGSDETVYAHLSKINVQRGQTVAQGQNVGLVGATGWATGPHLHFEFRVNGVHRDPLTVARQSEAVPVAAAFKPAFESSAQQVRNQLLAATQMQAGSID